MYNMYSKKVIEPFALKTIALSFNREYELYHAPKDTDSFDYISPTNDRALEITTAIPHNEIEAYIYETNQAKGKLDLKTKRIENVRIKEDGSLLLYQGGTFSEIIRIVRERIDNKQEKALKRLEDNPKTCVDLCVCIADGALLELTDFDLAFNDLDNYIFSFIFFITSARFICYSKEIGFKEYSRITSE